MAFYQQNIDFAIGRHKDAVRIGERNALRLAQVAPQAKAKGGLVRKAAEWVGRQRAGLDRKLVPAHGERGAG